MKIKLAILDAEQSYLSRITSALQSRYSEKLEIYCFTDAAKALAALAGSGIHVLMASSAFDVDRGKVPAQCGFAYLVESHDIAEVNDQRAVCKYQKIDQFYNSVLAVFADTKASKIVSRAQAQAQDVELVVFTSASGGAGTTSAAIACAISSARQGKRTLYLSLESFGNTDLYFDGEGIADFRDVLFAMKSGNVNAVVKLESSIRRDSSGIFYVSSPKSAMDILAMTTEDVEELLSLCCRSGLFDRVVVDTDFSADEKKIALLKQAKLIVFVCDGSDISNEKLRRAYESIQLVEQRESVMILERVSVFYNKFSNKTGKHVSIPGLSLIGGSPRFENTAFLKVISNLARSTAFDSITRDS
jgi:cellulose biosynthesis protein BcsQ